MSQTFQPYSFQPSTDSNIEHPITISSSSASPVKNSSQNPKSQEQVSKAQQGSDSELEEGEIIVKQVYSHDSSSEESSPEQRVASKSRSKQQQQSYKDRGRFRDEGKREFNLKENTKVSSMNKYYDNKGPQKHQPYYEQSKPYYFDQKKQGPANIPPQNNQRTNQGYQNQRNPNNIPANPPPYTSFANQNPPVSGPYPGPGNQGNQSQMNYPAPQNQPPQSTSQYYQNTQPQPYYSNNPPANVNMSHNNPAPFQAPPQNYNNIQNFQKPPNSYPGPQGVAPNQSPQITSYYNPPPQQQQQQQHAATALGFNIQYGVNQNNPGQQPSMPQQQQHQQQYMNAPQMIQGSNINQGNMYSNAGAHPPYYQNNPNPSIQQQQQPGLQQPFNAQSPHMLAPQQQVQQQVQNLVQPQMQDQKPNPISPYYQQNPQQQQQHQQNISPGYYRGGYSQPSQFGNNPPFNAQPQMQPQMQLQQQPQIQQQLQPQLQPQMQPQLQLQPQIQQQQQPQYAPPQFSPRQPYQMTNVNMTPQNPIPSGPHQPFVMQTGATDLVIKTPFSNNFNPNQPQAPETTFPNYYQLPFNKPPPTVIQDQTIIPAPILTNNSQDNNVRPISAEPVQIPERPQSQPIQPNEGVVDLTNSPPLTSQSKSVPPPPDAALKNTESQEKKLLKFFIDSVPIGKVTVNSEEDNTKKVETVKTIETEEKQYKLIGHDRWFRTQEKNLLEKLNKFLIPGENAKEEKKKEIVSKSEKEKESMEKATPEGKEKEEEIDDFNFETRYFMYNPTQVCNRCKKPGHFERMCTEDVVLRCMFCLGSHRMEECSQIVCFNCYGVGHRIRDCTLQESITCYRCGKKGHKNTRCGVLMPRDKEQLKREKKDYNISTKCSVCGNYGHPICQKNPVPSFGGGYLDDMYIEESFTESAEEGSLKRANSGSCMELENALDISPKKKLKTDKKDSINREVNS